MDLLEKYNERIKAVDMLIGCVEEDGTLIYVYESFSILTVVAHRSIVFVKEKETKRINFHTSVDTDRYAYERKYSGPSNIYMELLKKRIDNAVLDKIVEMAADGWKFDPMFYSNRATTTTEQHHI